MNAPFNIDNVPGLHRFENFELDDMREKCVEMTHAVYPHDKIYGKFCSIQEYINAPPDEVYEYLANTEALQEWTYSAREPKYLEDRDLWEFNDALVENTKLYFRTVVNPEAKTVDYHCAWDQGAHLWMIYLMRVIPAELVFNKKGSVVLWTNCHHPFYDENPYKETVPESREEWVGDIWDLFYAGHSIEMTNLKLIMEYYHANGIKVSDVWSAK